MKRVVILLTLLIFSLNPAFSEVAVVESEPLPNIFIWAIPDDEDGAGAFLCPENAFWTIQKKR